MEKRTTRSHYKIVGDKMTAKKSYDTEQEALSVARFLNIQPNIIHKMVVYKCIKCSKWHIGSNGTVLTEDEREKIKEKLKHETIRQRKENKR